MEEQSSYSHCEKNDVDCILRYSVTQETLKFPCSHMTTWAYLPNGFIRVFVLTCTEEGLFLLCIQGLVQTLTI